MVGCDLSYLESPETFFVSIDRRPERTLLSCVGELDIATHERLQDAIEILIAERPHHVELDTSGISFCDGRGAVLIHELTERCGESGIEFSLNPGQAVTKLLRLLFGHDREVSARHVWGGTS